MFRFTKDNLRVIAAAFTVAIATLSAPAFAQGMGTPIPPSLDFPEKGAIKGKGFWCVLKACAATPEVTKNTTLRNTQIGE